MTSTAKLDSQQPTSIGITHSKIDQIFHLLEEGERKLKNHYGHKNAVLVFGKAGSGIEPTFTKWITDNDETLVSKEDLIWRRYYIEDSAQDDYDIYPALMTNSKTGTAFYYLPVSIGTYENIADDVATTYFIRKIIHNIEKVKFIFLLNYNSLATGAPWIDFTNLMTNTMPMVKDFEKFRNSIIFIAYYVHFDNNKFTSQHIISNVAKLLTTARSYLQEEMSRRPVDHSRTIEFLDILLHENGDVYPRIQLFRSPDEAGPLREIVSMQDNKRAVVESLEKLNFASKNDDDFGYFVPELSFSFRALLGEVHQHVRASIETFGQHVQTYLFSEENRLYDIQQLLLQSSFVYNTLITTKAKANQHKEADKCVWEIVNGAFFPGDGTTHNGLAEALKYANYSSFLHSVVDWHPTMYEQFKCADGLNEAIEYADKTRKWYKFLIDLHDDILSSYDVQKNTTASSCHDLTKLVLEEGAKNINKTGNVLEPLVKKCDTKDRIYYESKDTIMNEPKFRALFNTVNFAINHRVDSSCNANRLLIKGRYVKFSDIVEHEKKCRTPPKFIHIFAAHRLFFDHDFERIGEIQLSVLAETWDVQSVRRIVLHGEHAKPLNSSKAANGTLHGQQGEKGEPGLPGSPGGHFLGVGNYFISVLPMIIICSGGQGGPGQHGGDGVDGNNGTDAYNDLNMNETYPKKSPRHKVLSHRPINGTCDDLLPCIEEEIYVLQGEEGERGGNGGAGGSGGLGGPPGTITFISTTHSVGLQFKNEAANGSKGLGGEGGLGGKGGIYGRNGLVHIYNPEGVWEPRTEFTLLNDSTEESPSGSDGMANNNADGIRKPRNSEPFVNKTNILNEYKTYIGENMYHSVREFKLKEFLDKLSSDTVTTTTTTTTTPSPPIPVTPEIVTIPGPTISAANALQSPINAAMNLIVNFFVPLKFIYPALVTDYKLFKTDITSMFEQFKSSRSDAYSTTNKLDEFSINGAIVLTDFLIRCVTKQKPHDNTEKPTDVSEIRAVTLYIITEFETILSDAIAKSNLTDRPLHFDPVSLVSKLDKMLLNGDYENLTKILFDSIDDNANLNYVDFENNMQPKIDRIIGTQNESNSSDCCVGVDNEIQDTNRVRNVICARHDFNCISFHPQSKENCLQRLN